VIPKMVCSGSRKVKGEYFLKSRSSRSKFFLSKLMSQQNADGSPVLFLGYLDGEVIS
jgi:hypothetical protein